MQGMPFSLGEPDHLMNYAVSHASFWASLDGSHKLQQPGPCTVHLYHTLRFYTTTHKVMLNLCLCHSLSLTAQAICWS